MQSLHCLFFFSLFTILKFTSCQFIVWDDYIDLCEQNEPTISDRLLNRCEISNTLIVEKRSYRDEEPYWCIKIKNTQNKSYRELKINLSGDEINRVTETTANIKRHKTLNNSREEVFELTQNLFNSIIIAPARPSHELQRIISLKLDNIETCSVLKADEEDPVFQSPKNKLAFRFLKKCYFIGSRIHRPRNRCELNDAITYEELSLRGEEYFLCVIVENGNGTVTTESDNQVLEIRMSNSNYYYQSVRIHFMNRILWLILPMHVYLFCSFHTPV